MSRLERPPSDAAPDDRDPDDRDPDDRDPDDRDGTPPADAWPRRVPRAWRFTPLMKASVAWHVAALGWLAARPRSWRLGTSLIALDHLLLVGASTFPHQPWLGPVIRTIPSAGERPDIVLSFDDGPDPDVTPRIAEILEARGLRASFFVIGERARRHPQLIRDLHRAGHRLENHTQTHPLDFSFSFLPRLGREIGDCQSTLEELTGRAPAYFRAPAGMRNPLLEGALSRLGVHLVSWSKRGYDTVEGRPERVFSRLTRDLRRGDILLLHDGNAARAPGGRAVSLEVLPRLLDHLEAAGLATGPMPEPMPEPRGLFGE